SEEDTSADASEDTAADGAPEAEGNSPDAAADASPDAASDTAPDTATDPTPDTDPDPSTSAEIPDVDEVSELIRSTNGPVRDLAFSPDSGWLAWSHPGIGRSLRQIKIARLADRTVVDVTSGRFEDEEPVFTRDGRYLAFLSWRGFDPVYDVHTGDLSFPLGCRPYLV
ncbi:peptidase S41, partial [Streptomyces sp. 2MCAF27]